MVNIFSKSYLENVEKVNRAIHFSDEKLEQKEVDHVWIDDLISKRGDGLDLHELAILSRSTGSVDYLEERIIDTFRSDHGSVRYVAPTFQTNNCIDVCLECGWNRDEDTKRIFLRPDMFERQIMTLKGMGFGVVEISNGTNPKLMKWDTLEDYMKIAKRHTDPTRGEGFGVCSAVFDDEVMSMVFPEHAQFWVQWMETYDLPSYFKVHKFTSRINEGFQRFSKANFSARLDSYDKVMAVGGDVMLGVQYGLNGNDPAFDTLMTISHARYLEREYGRPPLAFGTVKNTSTKNNQGKYADAVGYDFSDEEYRAQLAAYKLAMPEMGRWLNTRVPFQMIKGAIVDGDLYTGECSNMVPGLREGLTNYSNEQSGQFSVFELERQVWEQEFGKLNMMIDYAWMGKRGTVRAGAKQK